MVRRPELEATAGPSARTRAARSGRQAGREGQVTGDLPLASGLVGGVADGLLAGALAWAVLVLALVMAGGVRGPGPLFPALLLCLGAGATVGPWLQAALRRHDRRAPAARGRQRVVILGGGFGGVSAARRFEQLLPWLPDLDVTLVSQSNYLLFTPMLAEVAAGAVGPGNVGVPLRAACPLTRFHPAEVVGVDPARQLVHLRNAAGDPEALPYDQLVLALGAVPNLRDLPGVAERALTLGTLEDARRLRDHVLARLERADLERDPLARRRELTFVVAGGGFAGTEAVATISDLVASVLRYFPSLRPGEPRFLLAHARDRILPELGARLARYAHAKLAARGVELRLGVTVAGVDDREVLLSTGERIRAGTLVWAAGTCPNPLLAELPLARQGAAVLVDETLRVAGADNVWAVGDCACVPDVEGGGSPCPPTAQHAARQGRAVAENVAAAVTGRHPEPFRFRPPGFLVPLGHQSAAAELRGLRFSGLPAWLLWRAVYLAKLPGLDKRLRVLLDWIVEPFLPRDIVRMAAGQPGRTDPAGRRNPSRAA